MAVKELFNIVTGYGPLPRRRFLLLHTLRRRLRVCVLALPHAREPHMVPPPPAPPPPLHRRACQLTMRASGSTASAYPALAFETRTIKRLETHNQQNNTRNGNGAPRPTPPLRCDMCPRNSPHSLAHHGIISYLQPVARQRQVLLLRRLNDDMQVVRHAHVARHGLHQPSQGVTKNTAGRGGG